MADSSIMSPPEDGGPLDNSPSLHTATGSSLLGSVPVKSKTRMRKKRDLDKARSGRRLRPKKRSTGKSSKTPDEHKKIIS